MTHNLLGSNDVACSFKGGQTQRPQPFLELLDVLERSEPPWVWKLLADHVLIEVGSEVPLRYRYVPVWVPREG